MKFWIAYLAVVLFIAVFAFAVPALMSAKSDVAVVAAASTVLIVVGVFAHIIYNQLFKK